MGRWVWKFIHCRSKKNYSILTSFPLCTSIRFENIYVPQGTILTYVTNVVALFNPFVKRSLLYRIFLQRIEGGENWVKVFFDKMRKQVQKMNQNGILTKSMPNLKRTNIAKVLISKTIKTILSKTLHRTGIC